MLQNFDLKIGYNSEDDNIYKDFFVPALSNSIVYKRAVGYFSPTAILNATSALSQFVENNGKIQLIFAKLVSITDFEALKSSLIYDLTDEDFVSFSDLLTNPESLLDYRIKVLAYLFHHKKLELKVAIRPKGMFHQKIGLLKDADGNKVSFSGSMNETIAGLDPEYNSEEITVFKSWEEGQKPFVEKHEKAFEQLWKNEASDRTIVCDFPEVLKSDLNIIAEQLNKTPSIQEEDTKVREFFVNQIARQRIGPRVPRTINGNPFEIRCHQRKALNEWKNNSYHGILELATGTGKTITSIYAATKIVSDNEGFTLIVAVPYTDLADQWCEELHLFGINALKCYGNKAQWESAASSYISRNIVEQKEFAAFVVVNKTLKSEAFQNVLSQLDEQKMIFVGDECHHHGSKSFKDKLPSKANFKLGLSATPFDYMDEEKNERLKSFYGEVVYSYSLFEAVEKRILTPYEYYPIPVILTAEETDEYHEITDKISRQMQFSGTSNLEDNTQLKALLMQRARLVGTAKNKLVELEKLIAKDPIAPHSLFYCSDGRVREDDQDTLAFSEEQLSEDLKQKDAVSRLLSSKRIPISPFTSDENRSQRKQILQSFKNSEILALVAIRCLDEGIDVPACSTAYLLASSRNPRQFIQRRGRILRRSEGKEKAKIYDFVVVLPPDGTHADGRTEDFLRNELVRVSEFARHSLNHLSSLAPLRPWLEKYNLTHIMI